MRYFLLYMLIFILSCSFGVKAKGQGKDPFYPKLLVQKNLKMKISKLTPQQFCPQAKKGFLSDVEFEQLKVIGVVKNKQGYRALLLDDNSHIFELKKGDFVALQRMQLINVQLGKIQFKYWDYTLGCDHSQLMTLQL